MPRRFQLTENTTLSTDEREARGGSRIPAAGETETAEQLAPTAVLFATATSADGGPAAALPILGTTVVGRMLGQLATLGVGQAWLVTRPAWKEVVEAAADGSGLDLTVVATESVGGDLDLAAKLADRCRGPLLVGNAHVVTHREALAGVLGGPGGGSGVLMTASRIKGHGAYRFRSLRGRLVSAESPYHRIDRNSGYFLGLMTIAPSDRARFVDIARRLARLAAARPPGWHEELQRKERKWRLREWRHAVERETGEPPDRSEAPDPSSLRFDDATEARLALRRRLAEEEAVALLLVGLARSDVGLWPRPVRRFFHAAPVSSGEVERAAEGLSRADEDQLLLDSAVKSNDGFFTTYFVSPYSKYLARFAAERGWTPNAITVASLAIGLAAAAAFALGSRAGLVAGAVLLQISFTVDCVDGQLARYTRRFSTLGAWLDSVFDRMKEYVVYAGLAVGSVRGFDDEIWVLAAAALTLQTMRHLSDFAYVAAQRRVAAAKPLVPLEQPEDFPSKPAVDRAAQAPPARATATPRSPRLRAHPLLAAIGAYRFLHRSNLPHWGNRIIRLPIGERFALISLTAALATPRVTFLALLAWGGVAAVYAVSVRVLISYRFPRRLVAAVLR